MIAGGWGTEDFGRDHMIPRTMVGSQLNVIVQQHNPPPPEVKLCPELGIQCDTVTSERYGWVSPASRDVHQDKMALLGLD